MNTSTTITHAQAPPASLGVRLPARRSLRLRGRLVQGALLLAMVAGASAVWTVVPATILIVTGSMTDSHALLVLAVFVGVPAAMTLVGVQLARLERLYERATGAPPTARAVPAWRRSYSDGPSSGRGSVLDGVMVVSVMIAAAAWFSWFVFAGASL